MSSPEQLAQHNAVKRLYELSNDLNGMRGAIDVRDYEPYNEEYGLARLAVRAVAGQPIVGNTSDTGYFSFRLPVYTRDFLPRHAYRGTDFTGIIKRLVNINIPRPAGSGKRFCLQVAPLASGVGPEWNDYYSERGQQTQFNHPFANPDKAGKSVWIPLDCMGERAILFPQTPEETGYGSRRVRV